MRHSFLNCLVKFVKFYFSLFCKQQKAQVDKIKKEIEFRKSEIEKHIEEINKAKAELDKV